MWMSRQSVWNTVSDCHRTQHTHSKNIRGVSCQIKCLLCLSFGRATATSPSALTPPHRLRPVRICRRHRAYIQNIFTEGIDDSRADRSPVLRLRQDAGIPAHSVETRRRRCWRYSPASRQSAGRPAVHAARENARQSARIQARLGGPRSARQRWRHCARAVRQPTRNGGRDDVIRARQTRVDVTERRQRHRQHVAERRPLDSHPRRHGTGDGPAPAEGGWPARARRTHPAHRHRRHGVGSEAESRDRCLVA